jgi:phage N-6-adenine-methyltransferase
MIPEALVSSKSQDWATPWPVFNAMREVYPYDIDLCATKHSKKCETYIGFDQSLFGHSESNNSLLYKWSALPCGAKFGWCNPPYGDRRYPVKAWALKAFTEALDNFTSTLLLPINKMDQKWFHQLAMEHAEVRIVEGRIQFVDPVTGLPGKNSNSQGSMLITWGPNVSPRFRSIRFKI